MKIAVIVGSFPVVTQTFIDRQASALGASVIASQQADSIVDFKVTAPKVIYLESKEPRIKYLWRKVKTKFTRSIDYTWSKNKRDELTNIIKENSIKSVILATGTLSSVGEHLLRTTDCKIIIQFLGADASTSLSNRIYVQSLKKLFGANIIGIAQSDLLISNLLKVGVPQSKLVKCSIGVPTSEIPQLEKVLNNESFNFIAVGRFTPKKAPIRLLQAFKLAAERNKNVKLFLVGDGEMHDEVSRFVIDNNLQAKVKLLGYLGQSELQECYKKMDVFVQHSVTTQNGDCEGWPVGIAEAMCYGLPVISTKHSGIIDQVEHGINGYLVNENDFKSMGNYMLKLSRNSKLTIELGKNARKHIVESGDIKLKIETINKLWDQI